MDASDALAMWVAQGELDPDHASRLRMSLAAHEEPANANRLIWVLVSIGAVLIGGGLLLFIASQWDQSSPLRRLLLLLFVYCLTVAGAALCDHQRLHTTAKGLWFLSSIAVGVNVFLIGQVFNLPLNFWQGTMLWMIATLAMGWASPSSAQGWLAVPLGILTLGWISTPTSQFFEQGEFLWSSGGIRPLLPVIGLALIAIATLVTASDFDWLKRPAQVFGALMIAVPITVSTFHPAAFAWIFQIDVRLFHFVVLAAATGLVAASWKRHPVPLLGAGLHRTCGPPLCTAASGHRYGQPLRRFDRLLAGRTVRRFRIAVWGLYGADLRVVGVNDCRRPAVWDSGSGQRRLRNRECASLCPLCRTHRRSASDIVGSHPGWASAGWRRDLPGTKTARSYG